jgi:hypothetical protein
MKGSIEMKRRLFCETRIYDYEKVTDADKHIKEMKAKGWTPVVKNEEFGEYPYLNGQDDFKWSVEFYRNK